MGATVANVSRTFVQPHENKVTRSYAPSFYESGFLNHTHGNLVNALQDMRGKLEPGDHFKLYEAGYHAQGTIVEIGRLAGKSTVILGLGSKAAGHDHPIYSIEWDHKLVQTAFENLQAHDVFDRVTMIQGDSAIQLTRIPAPFDTVFVDGNHSYEGVRRDVTSLAGRLAPDAIVMFHDYFHPHNETGQYGVKRAVDEWAPTAGLQFRGHFGGIALFHHVG